MFNNLNNKIDSCNWICSKHATANLKRGAALSSETPSNHNHNHTKLHTVETS
jgi:hypothetical protein